MTVEPPQGLKANMLRSFGSGGTGTITEKKFEYKEAGPDWQKLLFGLCLFNSVIHERKKYGRLGWNVLYEFNDSDLSVKINCFMQVISVNNSHQNIWNWIFYAKLKKKIMQQARNFFVNLKFKKGNNQFSYFTLNLKKKMSYSSYLIIWQ